jgi:hypothetical protein
VRVDGDWRRLPGRAAADGRSVAGPAFENPPAEVAASPRAARAGGAIDLLPPALADIADPQVAGRPVEAEAPWVAQSEGPDLVEAVSPDERVGPRDPITQAPRPRVDVDPEELAQTRRNALGAVARVPARTSVAGRDVQEAVRAEGECTAVVVCIRLVDPKQNAFARFDGDVRLARCRRELRDDRVPCAVGVVDVEPAVRLERRMEC